MRPESGEWVANLHGERQGRAYDKDQFEVIDEGPPDGIAVLLILLFCCTTGYESITDEAVNR